MALFRALRRVATSLPWPPQPPPPASRLPLPLLDRFGLGFVSHGSSASCRAFSTSSASPSSMAPLFAGLTDSRFPKRRPGFASRRKRASLRPKGPHYWVPYKPGEPIPSSQPNKGSVQGRKEKKRIKQRKAFILSEKKKRKAQYAEARKRKENERIERKMAAVAREKAWAERLVELQQREEAKKAEMA